MIRVTVPPSTLTVSFIPASHGAGAIIGPASNPSGDGVHLLPITGCGWRIKYSSVRIGVLPRIRKFTRCRCIGCGSGVVLTMFHCSTVPCRGLSTSVVLNVRLFNVI